MPRFIIILLAFSNQQFEEADIVKLENFVKLNLLPKKKDLH